MDQTTLIKLSTVVISCGALALLVYLRWKSELAYRSTQYAEVDHVHMVSGTILEPKSNQQTPANPSLAVVQHRISPVVDIEPTRPPMKLKVAWSTTEGKSEKNQECPEGSEDAQTRFDRPDVI